MVQQIKNNQFVISTANGVYFQSYQSVVCKIDRATHKITFSSYWDYSRTTSKYLYQFLREYTSLDYECINKKGLQNLISKGIIEQTLTTSLQM